MFLPNKEMATKRPTPTIFPLKVLHNKDNKKNDHDMKH